MTIDRMPADTDQCMNVYELINNSCDAFSDPFSIIVSFNSSPSWLRSQLFVCFVEEGIVVRLKQLRHLFTGPLHLAYCGPLRTSSIFGAANEDFIFSHNQN